MLRGKQTIDYYNIHVSTEAKETRPRKTRKDCLCLGPGLCWAGEHGNAAREKQMSHT